MSRGYGRVQRVLLAVLEENEKAGLRQASEGMTTTELASAVYRTCLPTSAWLMPQSEMGAVRRALATLVRDGRVSAWLSARRSVSLAAPGVTLPATAIKPDFSLFYLPRPLGLPGHRPGKRRNGTGQ
jgi:hypothetical protein